MGFPSTETTSTLPNPLMSLCSLTEISCPDPTRGHFFSFLVFPSQTLKIKTNPDWAPKHVIQLIYTSSNLRTYLFILLDCSQF